MELSSSTGEIAIKVLDTSGDATDEPTKDKYQLTNVPKRCNSIVDLPNELLVQIISHLYNKDLPCPSRPGRQIFARASKTTLRVELCLQRQSALLLSRKPSSAATPR